MTRKTVRVGSADVPVHEGNAPSAEMTTTIDLSRDELDEAVRDWIQKHCAVPPRRVVVKPPTVTYRYTITSSDHRAVCTIQSSASSAVSRAIVEVTAFAIVEMAELATFSEVG